MNLPSLFLSLCREQRLQAQNTIPTSKKIEFRINNPVETILILICVLELAYLI
jgi:hypothetical protein